MKYEGFTTFKAEKEGGVLTVKRYMNPSTSRLMKPSRKKHTGSIKQPARLPPSNVSPSLMKKAWSMIWITSATGTIW